MRISRVLAASATAAGLIVLTAAPAFAHVEMEPDSASAGAEQTVNVRVPNEIDGAHTVKVELDVPVDPAQGGPVPEIHVQPVFGWTAAVTTSHLATPITTDDGQITDAVTQIVWTASAGGGITTNQYQLFPLLMTLPAKPTTVIFKAIQTYDNGTVVRWIEPPNPDGSAPDHPYPTLTLQAASQTNTPAATPAATVKSKGSDSTARTLGIVGVVLGAVALLAAGLGLARGRRTTGAV